jgi:hypothetical protein
VSYATTGCPVAGVTVQENGRQLASDQVFACAVDAGACGVAGSGCVHVRVARGMHTLTVSAPGYVSQSVTFASEVCGADVPETIALHH